MRFGGHETFAIREGWLHKGVNLLMNDPQKLIDKYSFDYLGVGRNMAKSIKFWLTSAGLSETVKDSNKISKFEPTELCKLIWENDPYFSDIGTWWVIHTNLTTNENTSFMWYWFANKFNLERFEKPVCVDAIKRGATLITGKNPSIKTLDRDVSCYLHSYQKVIPDKNEDPENNYECPLSSLEILKYFKNSGYYEVSRDVKNIPEEIFCYCLSLFNEENIDDEFIQMNYLDVLYADKSPGRVFILNSETLFELINSYESNSLYDLEIVTLATDRFVKIKNISPLEWLQNYYSNN